MIDEKPLEAVYPVLRGTLDEVDKTGSVVYGALVELRYEELGDAVIERNVPIAEDEDVPPSRVLVVPFDPEAEDELRLGREVYINPVEL